MSEAITKIINQTLASGVEPLRRVYHGVFDGYEDLPVAYVTETEVFLTATGVIKNYEDAIEEKEVGRRWSISNIAAAHRALTTIRENGKKANFVTAFVTKSFLEGNVADDLAALAKDGVTGEGVLLTFRESALLTSDQAKEGVATARAMGFQAALYGFNGAESLSGIAAAPVDFMFLSPEMTALSGDRDKPGLFNAIITLLRTLRASIVLCGVKTDDVIRDATAAECYGVMPDESYQGEFSFPKRELELDEVLKLGEGAL